ncbi:major facilitator superfamily domain-containing protein [Gautieria morchelliformis]|nr:major facilitator superfamily domain-containing protein [Gautieria morchelliformis]
MDEKHDGSDVTSSYGPEPYGRIYDRPKGFKGIYQHPTTQVCMLGFTCFMCPGLFNALNGLGLSGQVDSRVSANANSAIYATFAFGAFFAGSINNKLGSRPTLILGSLGYSVHISSYLVLNIHRDAGGFVIASGAILGICAGLLWSAQGSLMLAYPIESQKGLYIGLFWSIFNLGGVVGAAVPLGQNFRSKTNSVDNGTYITFVVLSSLGVLIPLLMTDPNKMIRTDGTKVTTPRHPSWKTEFYFLWVALRTDPSIIMLFPLFFASNWFYTWQFNDYNGVLFNIRTRSLNNFCYWLSQIVGSLAIGLLLDQRQLTRRTRAFLGWIVLLFMVFVVHTWAYFYQKTYTRASTSAGNPAFVKMDFKDKGYPAKIWLYIVCGMLDAMWQTAAYWMMGAMSNDPAKLAHFTGFYKSLQSAGAAGIWRADAVGISFMNIFASTWALLVAGLVFALPMLYLRVRNTTTLEEDMLDRMGDEDPNESQPLPEMDAVHK